MKDIYSTIYRACFLIILPYLAFFSPLVVQANDLQDNRVLDSIQTLLKASSGIDKVALYNDTWKITNEIDKKYALQLTKEGLALAKKLADFKGEASLSWKAGLTYQILGRYDSARYFIDRALQISTSHDLTETRLLSQYRLGSLLYRIGQSDSAKVLFKLVMYKSTEIGFLEGEMLSNSGLGKIAKRAGNYDEALQYFVKQVELAEVLELPSSTSHALLNIGILYSKLGDYPNAKSTNFKALRIAEQYNYVDRVNQLTNNLAVLYRLMAIYDSSLYYQQLGLQQALEKKSKVSITRAYMNFGTTYAYQKQFVTAEKYFDSAYVLAQDMDNLPLRMSVLQNLSAVSKDMGNYQESISIAKQALVLAKETKETNSLRSIYETIYASWKQLGQLDSALSYHELMFIYHDSIFNENKQKNIDEIKIKYESQKMESEYLILENRNLANSIALSKKKLQLNILMGAGFTGLVTIFMIWMIYRVKHRRDIIIRQQEIDRLKREQEILAVQLLIEGQEVERKRIAQELHDGIGVMLSTASLHLSNLSDANHSSETLNKLAKADDMLREAGNELRKISHNMMPGVLSSFGLFDALEDLLEEVGESSSMDVAFTLQGSKSRLGDRIEIMIYRIIQELVNNTLKYADASHIDLKIQRFSNSLMITYKDNGLGFDIEKVDVSSSLGLSGIRSRVDLLHGSIDFESGEGEGVRYKIQIPV